MERNEMGEHSERVRVQQAFRSAFTSTRKTHEGNIRVTFSSNISNCFKTDPIRRCECSSTTRIFHRPGGFTDRIASKNSVDHEGRTQSDSHPGLHAPRARERMDADALDLTLLMSDDIGGACEAAGLSR